MPDGRLRLARAGGATVEAAVHPQTTVWPWLVVLLCRIDGRLESLVLPRFAMDAEDHRRLRVWLRWKAVTASSAA